MVKLTFLKFHFQLAKKLSEDLTELQKWFDVNKLSLNVEKSEHTF